MQLKNFQIENFQSHENTTIDFSSGLNIIVGETDAGKSSIIRALRKLIRDEPSGKSFISNWATSTTLALSFVHDNVSHTVIRKVTQSKNLYYLDSEEYGGFGKTIPKEVQNSLNMQLISLEGGDTIDLHFTDQHDPPFMVTKGSAGNRSKILGKIAGLHVLDRAILRVNSDIRAENSKLKHQVAEIDSLEYELDDFPDLWYEKPLVTTLAARIHAVELQIAEYSQIKASAHLLENLGSKIVDLQSRLDQIPSIEVDFNSLSDNARAFVQISRTIHELNYYQDQIDKTKDIILCEISGDFEGIKRRIKLFTQLTETHNALVNVATEAKKLKNAEDEIRLNECLTMYSTILHELKICPTCKRRLEGPND